MLKVTVCGAFAKLPSSEETLFKGKIGFKLQPSAFKSETLQNLCDRFFSFSVTRNSHAIVCFHISVKGKL